MEIVSLHPLDKAIVERYVSALGGSPPAAAWSGWFSESLRQDVQSAKAGNEGAANRITLNLARALGQAGPVFTYSAFGLSFWEAQVDRPIGMLMRPPSRLFVEAGFDPTAARTMPIRLDLQHGMMGGAYIPARLIEQAWGLLQEHMERSVKRLAEAEYDPVASFGLMYEAIGYARERGLGLYEAIDVIGPDGQGGAGMAVVRPDRKRLDRELANQIAEFLKPPKKPGLMSRIFGRGGGATTTSNGQHPEN